MNKYSNQVMFLSLPATSMEKTKILVHRSTSYGHMIDIIVKIDYIVNAMGLNTTYIEKLGNATCKGSSN